MSRALAWRTAAWGPSYQDQARPPRQQGASVSEQRVAEPGNSARAGNVERLGWLDVARAVAVTATALMHLSEEAFPFVVRFTRQVLNPGIFGIVLFFLISGFVIPLTLERRGSLGAFAVARLFRLYPLYWFSLFALMILYSARLAVLSGDFAELMPTSFWWNVTMVQSWVGQPDAIGLYWTLGYELGFYVASTLLFALGIHRATAWIVSLFAAYFFIRGVAMAALGYGPFYHSPLIWMATFPVGTLWYRAWSRRIGWRRAGVLTALFTASVAASYAMAYGVLGVSSDPPPNTPPNGWIYPHASLAATGLAYATFVFLVATRSGEHSRVLIWLGRISYSLYLMHGLVLKVPLALSPWLAFAVRLAAVLLLSALTYRYLESPFIRWGHVLIRRLGFSRSDARAIVVPMTASTTTAVAETAGSRPVESSPAPSVPTRSLRTAIGFGVGVLLGGMIGYFTHNPATTTSFVNFDVESTPSETLSIGWSGFEQMPNGDSFSWCAAKSCSAWVDSNKGDQVVRVRMFPYMYPGSPAQTAKVTVNGTPIGSHALKPEPTVYDFKAPANAWKPGRNEIRFDFTYAEAPKGHVEGADDPRTLSAAIDWIDVVPPAK